MKAFVRPHPQQIRSGMTGRGLCYGGQGYASITSDNDKLKEWRAHVTAIAIRVRARFGQVVIDEPCELHATFFLPRPTGTPKHVLYPVKRPDLDKLMRAIGDSLEAAGMITSDSFFVNEILYKRFAPTREQVGVAITLRAVV
jgi:Holliday junction resolvase RusA-like endonuclease